MTTANDARKAHDLLDELDARAELSQEQEKLLRSFLPERPKDATLVDLLDRVHAAWLSANASDWGFDTPAEHHDWLFDLRDDLIRIINEQDTLAIKQAKSAHPEFLETEADYASAPRGTVAAKDGWLPWLKETGGRWSCGGGSEGESSLARSGKRRILRWGWANEQFRESSCSG